MGSLAKSSIPVRNRLEAPRAAEMETAAAPSCSFRPSLEDGEAPNGCSKLEQKEQFFTCPLVFTSRVMFPELEGPTKGRCGMDIGLGTFAREETYILGQIPARRFGLPRLRDVQ